MDSLSLLIDQSSLRDARDKIVRDRLRTGTSAVRTATKNLERSIEAAVRSAVGGKLWRAVASNFYPETGIAQNPTGSIFLNGRDRTVGAFTFFTKPGRIQSKDDFYLAIPTPAAGPRNRNGVLTPGEWERRNGVRLRFVYRPGRPSLLVLDEGVLSGKRQVGRLNTDRRRATGRGNTTVVIFVLLPSVAFANSVALEGYIRAAEAEMVRMAERGS